MKLLLDSSAVIASFQFPFSNSRIIFDLVLRGKVRAVVSEKVLYEVKNFLLYKHSERLAYGFEMVIRKNFEVIPVNDVRKEMNKWREKIKEKDLEHLATAKHLGLKYIVAFDRDFESFSEYFTPKQFVEKILKMKPFETEY